MIREFNILTHPLNLGTQSLIEASAGTGKTTALENLVLRLLLEGVTQSDGTQRAVTLSEILLVTFTEAATAELVQRVREKISSTLEEYDKNDKKALALRMALLCFDENSILTIHSFCHKMLGEFSFESNCRFDLELISDEDDFLNEVVADYWRKNFYDIEDELEVNIAAAFELNPAGLKKLLKSINSAPLTPICVPEDTVSCKDVKHELHDAYHELKEFCENTKLLHLLRGDIDNFLKKPFRKELENAFNCYLAFGNIFDLIGVLIRRKLEGNLKKKTSWMEFEDSAPDAGKLPKDLDRILDLFEHLELCVEKHLILFKYDFIKYVREEKVLKRKKLAENVQSFDDLLFDMYEAVNKSEDFCALIRQKFAVVMLDEFQDTDPLQFQIFKQIFKNDESLMIMVGDPKQSIYQFRGADIFSYLQVSENLAAEDKSTLTKNYRSDEALLKAFNCIFNDKNNPFVEESIRYLPASAGRKQCELIIEDGSDNDCKLKIMNGGKIGKKAANKIFNKAICDKIVTILSLAGQTNENGQLRARFENIDGSSEPVIARDIAVLVARNEDAQAVYEQLTSAGVHATLQRSGNVFEADEATELLLLFNAIIQPGDASRVKSVLVTSLFRLNALELEELGNDAKIEAWQKMFFTLLQTWQEKGFIQMFFQLLRSKKTNVKANLLTLPHGERRLTNLMHLMELLHQQVMLKQLSPTALIHYLHQQITDPGSEDEHELRLESDDSAVKIMTVHKSKGLQFPIVFCLNLWQKEFIPKYEDEDFFYHDDGLKQHFAIKAADDNYKEALNLRRKEVLGELIRLTYVALTRAKNYCCFTLRETDKADKSVLAYLSNPPTGILNDFLKNGGKTGISLDWLENDNIEIIDVSDVDLNEKLKLSVNIEVPEWKTLPLLRAVPRDWGIMSFSAITDGSHQEDELCPGDDDEIGEGDNFAETSDLFSRTLSLGDFPKGPVAGNCIHSIFEKFNFADVKSANWRKKKTIERMIKEQLFIFGMVDGGKGSAQFIKSETLRYNQICDMLENVLTCPLAGQDGVMRLGDLDLDSYRAEMQFFFPADKVLDSTKINELLEHFSGRKSSLPPVQLRGFVNGFIDLIFEVRGRYYIIDWKSNDLGSNLNDYDRSGMARSMHESYYYLQAAIYLLALHKYLRKRLPDYDFEKHLGGTFYVYVRGVKNDFPDTGIYNMRPERKTLELLENIFG